MNGPVGRPYGFRERAVGESPHPESSEEHRERRKNRVEPPATLRYRD